MKCAFLTLFLFQVDIGANDAADANILVSLTDGWTDQEKNVLRFVCKFDIVTIIIMIEAYKLSKF